jgi:hypothetical protein
MGGRVGGVSPREEKIALRNSEARTVRPCQIKDAGDTVTATDDKHAFKQQLAVWRPLGQQDAWPTS